MRSFDYLTLYQNSFEVEEILAAIDSEIDELVAEVERVRNMCFIDTAGEDISNGLMFTNRSRTRF